MVTKTRTGLGLDWDLGDHSFPVWEILATIQANVKQHKILILPHFSLTYLSLERPSLVGCLNSLPCVTTLSDEISLIATSTGLTLSVRVLVSPSLGKIVNLQMVSQSKLVLGERLRDCM